MGQVVVFVVMLLAATAIVYALWLMMVSLAFWFVRLDNFTELFLSNRLWNVALQHYSSASS